MSDETNFGQFTLKMFDFTQYMKLDSSFIQRGRICASPNSLRNGDISNHRQIRHS